MNQTLRGYIPWFQRTGIGGHFVSQFGRSREIPAVRTISGIAGSLLLSPPTHRTITDMAVKGFLTLWARRP